MNEAVVKDDADRKVASCRRSGNIAYYFEGDIEHIIIQMGPALGC